MMESHLVASKWSLGHAETVALVWYFWVMPYSEIYNCLELCIQSFWANCYLGELLWVKLADGLILAGGHERDPRASGGFQNTYLI